MLTALPGATNDLTLPCHEQRAGAATAQMIIYIMNYHWQLLKIAINRILKVGD